MMICIKQFASRSLAMTAALRVLAGLVALLAVMTLGATAAQAQTAPGQPTGLTATAPGLAQIDLSWTAPTSDGGATISGYKIEVSTDGNAWADLAANTGNTDTTYSHTSLAANSVRHYRVSAINSVGAGAVSATAMETSNVYVRNTGQGRHQTHDRVKDLSQRFTTGDNPDGYTLTGIDIVSADSGGDDFSAEIRTVNTRGLPASTHARLTAPDSFAAGTLTFTAPENTLLTANTTYAFVVSPTDTFEDVTFARTTSRNEDAGGSADWSIQNTYEAESLIGIWNNNVTTRSLRIAVRGVTVTDNTAPVFNPTTVTLSVDENTAAGLNVGGAVTATDADTGEGDTLTYTLVGADATSFDIDPANGQIRTKAALDHEVKSSHAVTVTATDTFIATATATVTIDVGDVNEPPDPPAMPGVSVLPSKTVLAVSWVEPANDGKPDITSYDLRYRESTAGSWTDGPQDVSETSKNITGLTANTDYEVQVRATNDEGDSGWSPIVAVTTNNAPVFSSVTVSRSVEENTAASQSVGAAVAATDGDTGDTLTYTLGGTDASSFGIVSTSGQIQTKTGVTYDHEAKASYTVTVTATDGVGAAGTATVHIAVTDVEEAPGTPTAPTVAAISKNAKSLKVSWGAPTNTGPAIAGYDLRYREGTSGDWEDGPQDQSGRTVTLTGLTANTLHQAQVRATNAEGDSSWSSSGSATTNALNTDATLSGLTVNSVSVAGFASATTSYQVGAPSYSATLVATPTNSAATVVINVKDKDTNAAGHQIPLSHGDNPVEIRVTSENSANTTTYKLSVNRGTTATFGWKAVDDFDGLKAASNSSPQGLWSDGVTMWIGDAEDDKVYAYKMSDRSRDSGKDVDTLSAVGNNAPRGIWSDGVTMWVADYDDDKIYAYRMSDGNHDPAKDFDTLKAAGNNSPQGIWSDGVTMWVADSYHAKLFAYRLSNKIRDRAREFDPPRGERADYPYGIWSDGTTMWVTHRSFAMIYAFRMSDQTRNRGLDFHVLPLAGIWRTEAGIWSDGTTMWVADQGNGKLASFNHPFYATSATVDGATLTLDLNRTAGSADLERSAFTVKKTPEGGAEETASLASDPAIISGGLRLTLSEAAVFSDTFTVSYARPSSGSNNKLVDDKGKKLSSFTNLAVTNVSTHTADMLGALRVNSRSVPGFAPDRTSYQFGVGSTVAVVTVAGTANDSRAAVTYSPADADPVRAGHQVRLSEGKNAVTVTVTALDRTSTETYRVSVNRGSSSEFGWKASDDWDGLAAAGNVHPTGIWSNGTTMWVVNDGNPAIYAYRVSDRTRDSAKDFTTLVGASNLQPVSIWSDGETMWVSDNSDATIYAYRMSNRTRDSAKDFTESTLLAAGNGSPRGIWSDGTTMWVADWSDERIYAYRLSNRTRDGDKDFVGLNSDLFGIWSDGTTMWVSDTDDDKIYAYRMSNKSRDRAKEFDTLGGAGNGRPVGIWSDGDTVWVTDTVDGKVYSYNHDFAASEDTVGVLAVGESTTGRLDAGDPEDWLRLAGMERGKTYRVTVDFMGADAEGAGITIHTGGANWQWDSNFDGVAIVDVQAQSPSGFYVGIKRGGFMRSPVFYTGGYSATLTEVTVSRELGNASTFLVGNIKKQVGTDTFRGVGAVSATSNNQYAQSFTTGSHPGGYQLDRITAFVTREQATGDADAQPSAAIYDNSASLPGTKLCDLTTPVDYDTGFRFSGLGLADTLYAGECAERGLAKDTTYWVVFGETSSPAKLYHVVESNYDTEDTISAEGWAMGNDAAQKAGGAAWASITSKPLALGIYGSESTNRAPAFPPGEFTLSVRENKAGDEDLGTPVAATDPDGDTLTYSLGLDDGAFFTIDWTTGQIKTKIGVTYDYEATETYAVTVTATDTYMATDTILVDIDVTDVREPPAQPGAPALAPRSHSMIVNWGAPLNANKPPITGYDLQYRVGSSSSFTNGPQNVRGTRATISGLSPSTAYQVRVRAKNNEGNSRWSNPSGATTSADAPGNNAATGAPTISGTAQVGEPLTADSAGISDIDGVERARFEYQWLVDDEVVIGGTGPVYVPLNEDFGKVIAVTATFTDDQGYEESLTSEATAAVLARADLEPDSAAVDGATLTVTFDEILDETRGGVPTGSAFTVHVGSDTRTVSAVAVRGYIVTLTLESAVAAGETVTVDYAGRDGRRSFIRDTLGRVAVAFSGQAVTNNTAANTAANDAPVNTAATGAPAISGTARVGETLTASTTGIGDEDGLDNVSYAYQWVRNDGTDESDISGATGSAYTLAGGDEGKTIEVRVSFTDDAGNAETLTSAATAAVAAAVPALTAGAHDAAASHDGSASFTFELRFSEEFVLSYVRLRDHAFTVTGGVVVKARRLEQGQNVRWEITVRPDGNGDVTVVLPATTDCAATGAICTGDDRKLSNELTVTVAGPASNSPATGAPAISGTARVGETLTASTTGIGDEDGLDNVSYAYQWVRNDGTDDSDIGGATGGAYTLAGGDEGKTIRVRVSFIDDAGNAETLTSAATVAVEARPNSPATGAPAISGTARVGETLTASTTGIGDEDGLDNVSYAYQWVRNDGTDDSDIGGATGGAYTLAGGDEGKTIEVRVSFIDDAGNAETLTSAATVAVAKAPLTARASEVPGSHDGSGAFTFELHFSEEFDLSYVTLRDDAFTVTGGSVRSARRLTPGSNAGWEITVQPSGDGTVTVTLPVTTDCEAEGAICTGDDRMLSNETTVTVTGP